jgi:hypothetical protein
VAFETTGQFQITQALTANQADVNPLTTWAGRICPGQMSQYTFLVDATTAGVRIQISSGGRAIWPKSQVKGGGTAGTIPAALSTTPITFNAYSNEEIQLLLTETLGGTPSVNILGSYEVIAG